MYLKRMSEEIKSIGDAISGTAIALGVTIKSADFLQIMPSLPTWREVAMDNIAFLIALFTLVWVFFRAVDTVIEKIRQAQGWYQRRCKR
jgi:hypothetical protein